MPIPGFRNISQRLGGVFNQETAGFRRFHNDDQCHPYEKQHDANETTELSYFSNNGKTPHSVSNGNIKGDGDGWPEGGYTGILEVVEAEVDKKSKRNRISAWQAGWNVTNAIQVIGGGGSV